MPFVQWPVSSSLELLVDSRFYLMRRFEGTLQKSTRWLSVKAARSPRHEWGGGVHDNDTYMTPWGHPFLPRRRKTRKGVNRRQELLRCLLLFPRSLRCEECDQEEPFATQHDPNKKGVICSICLPSSFLSCNNKENIVSVANLDHQAWAILQDVIPQERSQGELPVQQRFVKIAFLSGLFHSCFVFFTEL